MGALSKRAKYCSCIAGIVAADRDYEWEDKFDNAAKQEANTCFNPIELSYESTIVEDIEELVSTAWTRKYFLSGVA